MSEIVVEANKVSKKFCRSLKYGMKYTATDVMRDTLGLRGHNETLRKSEFWAVKDLSFQLRRGECLGLIGANGAGKSTLLKMLNGIIRPDLGTIKMRGRIGALIEVGAGFHPMLTGRENIYVNGAILGMSRKEVESKYDEIVAFADLPDGVLESPVKSYSSGMYARLGFAVAAHCDPDILLVDEILSVGDLAFQSKCWRHIHWLRDQGTTIILVSHSGLTIREVCKTALWLDQGQLQIFGDVDEAVSMYEQAISRKNVGPSEAEHTMSLPGYEMDFRFIDPLGESADAVACGDPLTAQFDVKSPEDARDLHLLLEFHNIGTKFYTSYATEWDGTAVVSKAGEKTRYQVKFPSFNLPVGDYLVSALVSKGTLINHCVFDYQKHRLKVTSRPRLRGDMECAHEWIGATEVAA